MKETARTRRPIRLSGTVWKRAVIGLESGVVLGALVGGLRIVSQRYGHFGLYRLGIYDCTEVMNLAIVGMMIATLSIKPVLKVLEALARRLCRLNNLEIRTMSKNTAFLLMRNILFSSSIVFLVLEIYEFARGTEHDAGRFLAASAAAACGALAAVAIGRIDRKAAASRAKRPMAWITSRKTGAAFAALALIANVTSAVMRKMPGPSSPNILLIVSDALRADHLGCYGYDRATSPNIDKLAAHSLVCDRAWSNSPWTKPSVASILTSLPPSEHRVFFARDKLPVGRMTLAEFLRDKNYDTIAIQTNPLLSKRHEYNQGFHDYYQFLKGKGEAVTGHFLTWLGKHGRRPFFAYLHYMDTHMPYDAEEELSRHFGLKVDTAAEPISFFLRLLSKTGISSEDKHYVGDLYDKSIRYFDENIGIILARLDAMGRLDNTIVVITSDHGEEFWEHGGYEHGHSLYSELLRSPIIIGYTSRLQGKRISRDVQLVDLFPTILHLAGMPEAGGLAGNDLLAERPANEIRDDPIYSEDLLYGEEKKALIHGRWKLIENTGKKYRYSQDILGDLTGLFYPEGLNTFELYDLDRDPGEGANLIDACPERAEEMKKILQECKAKNPSDYELRGQNDPLGKTRVSRKTWEDLKSLGYVK